MPHQLPSRPTSSGIGGRAPRLLSPATALDSYKTASADAVEDGRLTYEEADNLTRQARRTRLTGTQLRELHVHTWEVGFPQEIDADWTTLTPVRRREMYLLAEARGLTELADRLTEVIHACTEPEPPPEARYLRGLRVAIVGDHSEVSDGTAVGRSPVLISAVN